jgi:hypothetical protein
MDRDNNNVTHSRGMGSGTHIERACGRSGK